MYIDDDDDDCVRAKEVSVLLLLCAGGRGRGRVVDESEGFHFLEREPWFKIVRELKGKEKRGTFKRSERFFISPVLDFLAQFPL